MDITLAELMFSDTAACSKHGYMQWVIKIMMIWVFAAIVDLAGMGVDIKYGMGGFMVGTTTLFLLYPIIRLNAARCRARGQSPNQHWVILGPAIAIVLLILISTDGFSGSPIPKLSWIFVALAMILHFMLVGIPRGPGEIPERAAAANSLFGPADLSPLPEEPPAPQELADYSAPPELPPGDPALDAPHAPMTEPPAYDAPYVPQPPAEPAPYMPPEEPIPAMPTQPADAVPPSPQEEKKPADEPPPLPPLA